VQIDQLKILDAVESMPEKQNPPPDIRGGGLSFGL